MTGGSSPRDLGPGIDVQRVPGRYPTGPGWVRRLLRKLQPVELRRRIYERALVNAATESGARCFYPTSPRAIGAARRAAETVGGAVVRRPEWGDAGTRDLVRLAPGDLEWSSSPAGRGATFFTPDDRRAGTTPARGRHAGKKVLVVYARTEMSPGRYLEEALRRAGVSTLVETRNLDWADVDPDTDSVVFVESPYPALEIRGTNPGIPVLMWVHHGEHHLAANLRLVERYGVDAVLLAHSWHLAHRFPVPVHRFPFGYASWLMDASVPFGERQYDVAMVGSQLDAAGGVYERRQALVADVRGARPPDRVAFESEVDAQRMAAVYAQARIVLNEGGSRHYPITMRVFEAVGAGALLLTDDLPGTDQIFTPGLHYRVLESDVPAQIRDLVDDGEGSGATAEAAHRHAIGRHSYDHRVDELLEIVAMTPHHVRACAVPERSAMASLIDEDVDVHRVAAFGLPHLVGELPTREVWDGERILERLDPNTMEAVAVGVAGRRHLMRALRAARKFAYVEGNGDAVDAFLAQDAPHAGVTSVGPVRRIDFLAASYRILPSQSHQLP